VFLAAALLGVVGSQVYGVAPSFQGLGDLPGGEFESTAHDVSGDGAVAVGMSKSSNGKEAFRWANGVMTPLGSLPGGTFLSVAWGVSADGSVVVGASSASGPHIEAFRWSNGAMVGLGDLPGGEFLSVAEATSADGSVVVGRGTPGASVLDNEGFLWANGVMTSLGDLPGKSFYSAAQGVSGDGSVVVGYSESANGYEACRWANGLMSGLGDLPGGDFYSTAEDVSADGSVIVGYSKSGNGYEAFRLENGMMAPLGDLPGGDFYSLAQDVSADGSLVVGYSKTANGKEAFLWTAGTGMRNLRDVLVNDYGLDLTGWTLTQATGVSDDGMTIVGEGLNPSGDEEGWIARIGLTLTVVVSNPACGALRVEPNLSRYFVGTVVTLTATPAPNCRVKSWSGSDEDTSVAKINTVTMTANKTVTVVFEAIPSGTGTLSIDTGPVKGEVFVNSDSWGTAPQSREVPVGPYTVGFGDVEGYGHPPDQTVTVSKDQSTRVMGRYVQYALTVSVDGPGTVQTDPDRTAFGPGETVTLKAVPLAASDRFLGWGGDVDAAELEITITMDLDKRITATFGPGVCPATCFGPGVCQIGLMGLGAMAIVRSSRTRTGGVRGD